MSTTPTITLGGHVLNDRFSIVGLSRPLPPSRVERDTVPGRHGDAFRARTMGPRKVSFELWSHSRDHATLCEEAVTIASWLWGESAGLIELTFSDEGGRIRRVVPDGDLSFDEYEERGQVKLDLSQPDPICDVVPARTVSIPSGGSATFAVGGTHPAKLSVLANSAKRNTSTQQWALQFDEGAKLCVETGSNSARKVEIDCAAGIVKLAGATHMVTLDSDWPVLWPGTHTVVMTEGTGAATLTVLDRSI